MKRGFTGKVILALLMTAVLCLPMMVQAATSECNHSEYTTRVEPATCTEPERTTKICSICGTVISEREETAPALGHAYECTESTEATCTADGSKTYTCSRCGASYSESVPARGHQPQTVSGYAATCEAAGKTDGSVCSVCGEVLTAQQDISATGHAWDSGTVTTPASCTQEGVRTFTCANCGATYTESISKTEHIPETIPAVAATCEQPGKTEGSKCSVCGEILTAQKDIAAIGHDWGEWQVGKEPTCEEKGKDYSVCKNCGQTKYRDNIEPLGHEWDEGVVTTEPVGFTPGVITYTCKRDASHTKTEPIEPISTMMGKLRGNPPPAGKGPDPLEITVEPVGGKLKKGKEPLTLSVEASGGTGSYHYEWFYEDIIPGNNATTDFLTNWFGSNIQDGYQKAKETTGKELGKFKQEWLESIGIDTLNTPGGGKITATLHEEEPNLFAHSLHIYESTCLVDTGNRRYWCVVTDDADGKATSQKAEVDWQVTVVDQTEYVNLYNESDVLHVDVQYGTSPYTYEWSVVQENGEVDISNTLTGNDIRPDKSAAGNRYVCTVTDQNGDEDRSLYTEVYYATPLTLTCTEREYLREGETAEFAAFPSGGVEPYTVSWFIGAGTQVNLAEKREDGGYYTPVMTSHNDSLDITFEVTDAKDNTVIRSTGYDYRQLIILKQPEDGDLNLKGSVALDIEVADGQQPYRYVLQDPNGDRVIEDAGKKAQFIVGKPGWYSIYVEDANGEYAWSDNAVVTGGGPLELADYTDVAYVSIFGKSTELSVTVKGGEKPYTFAWTAEYGELLPYVKLPPGDHQSKTSKQYEETSEFTVYDLSSAVSCTVTDAQGDSVVVENMRVEYNGKKPVILVPPVGGKLPYSADGNYSVSMNCKAFGSCADELLEYEWHKIFESGKDLAVQSSAGGSTYSPSGSLYQTQGTYYCIVTDPFTGESVETKKVKWEPALAFVGAEQKGNDSCLTFTFQGGNSGNGRYIVECYTLSQDHRSHDYLSSVNYKTEVFEGPDGTMIIVTLYSVPLYYTDENGNKQSYTYHVKVTDSNKDSAKGSLKCRWSAVSLDW